MEDTDRAGLKITTGSIIFVLLVAMVIVTLILWFSDNPIKAFVLLMLDVPQTIGSG